MTDDFHKVGSKALAVIGTAIWIVLLIIGIVHHAIPSLSLIVLSVVANAVFFVISFKNTFETNDSWKTWGYIAVLILSYVMFLIPISSHAV